MKIKMERSIYRFFLLQNLEHLSVIYFFFTARKIMYDANEVEQNVGGVKKLAIGSVFFVIILSTIL